MNKFSDYKKAVDILFGIGGWREIGGYIDENGIRTPAITISNKMEYQNGNEVYKVTINRKILDKLTEEEDKNDR
jgi:hypothetical protein